MTHPSGAFLNANLRRCLLILQRGQERKEGREGDTDVRATLIGCLPFVPPLGVEPETYVYVPRLATEPTTFWCRG